jgi:predicted metalloprotease with PDZ domain
VQALQRIAPYDWNRFLRAHLDEHDDALPLNGLTGTGWQLVYDDIPTAYARSLDKSRKQLSLSFSLGLSVQRDVPRISEVIWDSPAWRAGLAPGMTVIAVGGFAYSEELMKEAVSAAKTAPEPIELLIRDGERYRTVKLDYHQGLRYPRLVRIEGRPDRLAALLKPRT